MGLSIDPKHLKRYGQLAAVLVRHGRSDVVRSAGLDTVLEQPLESTGEPRDGRLERRGEALAEDLEDLGPTFIKLGQLLSTRIDLLPPEYIDALARLQDRVEPFDYEEVERIVSTELGVRLSKAFESFDPEPMAAASLGQVHRAVLRDGRPVAVKVQRPGIRERVRDDLDALHELAAFLDRHSDRAHRFRLVDILEEFRRSLIRELDYRSEAENLRTLGRNLADIEEIYVPQPIDDYSTSRVLTMEMVRGRKVTSLSPLALMELDREHLGDQLFRAYLKQILIDGFFHADPHPGNVFITDDGRIALLDLGMTGTLGPERRESLFKLMLAVADGEGDAAARMIMGLSEPEDGADIEGFSGAVAELIMRTEGRSTSEIAVGAIFLQLVRLAGEHRIRPPSELALLGKMLFNLDQVGRTIDPDQEPNRSIRRHATELMERQVVSSMSPARIYQTVLEANELVQEMPSRLNRILKLVADNEMSINVDAIDQVQLISGLEKIANRITLGLVIAALIIGAAMLVRVEGGAEILGYPALALIFFLAAALAGVVLAISIIVKDVH